MTIKKLSKLFKKECDFCNKTAVYFVEGIDMESEDTEFFYFCEDHVPKKEEKHEITL